MSNPNESTVFPCGCKMTTQNDTFYLAACPLGERCEVVQYTNKAAAELDKPMGTVDLSHTQRLDAVMRCPYCDYKLDGFTGPDHTPDPGDVAICMECGEPGVYDPAGIRKPNKKEARQMANDPTIREMKKMVKALHGEEN